MFNVTGGELLLILVMALIVLGPERLPDAARQIGKAVAQLRDLSGNFQREIRDAFDEPSPPVVKPNARPQLTAIEGGARATSDAAPIAAAPVDGGESLAVSEAATEAPPSDDGPPAPPEADAGAAPAAPAGEAPAGTVDEAPAAPAGEAPVGPADEAPAPSPPEPRGAERSA